MDINKKEGHPTAAAIGKRLKEAREKKSLTIEQVQKETKIHSSVLIALEEGRASEILTDTYVRSFLKKYAQLLGLSAGEIVKEYFPPHLEQADLNIPFNENPLPEEMRIIPKFLYFTGIVILVILALLTAVIIGGKIITAFNKAKLAQQQKQPAGATVTKKKTSKSAKSVQKRNPAAKVNSESKYIIPKSTPLNLVIKVKEPVLVKLTRDGVLIFSRVMAKGLVENITANETIELEISRAQALDLTLNDHPITLPAKNSIFTIVITRKGVKIK